MISRQGSESGEVSSADSSSMEGGKGLITGWVLLALTRGTAAGGPVTGSAAAADGMAAA